MSRKPRKRRTRKQKIRSQERKAREIAARPAMRAKERHEEKVAKRREKARKKRMRENPVRPCKIIDGDLVEAVVESCWAGDAVSGCGGRMEREHLVSECILPADGNIMVRGALPNGKIQTFNRKNISEYILCGNHNRLLGRADQAARDLADMVRDDKPLSDDPDFQFRLAMWVLKTHCNWQVVGSRDASGNYVPTHIGIDVVRSAFGQNPDMSYKAFDLRGHPINILFASSDNVVTHKLKFGNKPGHDFDFQIATNPNGPSPMLYCCLHNILVMVSLVPDVDFDKLSPIVE